MKKYVVILAVFVLLLGFATFSYATKVVPSDVTAVVAKGKTEITLGGELRVRGIHIDNPDVEKKGTPFYERRNYYDYRVRLNLDVKLSPNTQGFVELESGPLHTGNVVWGGTIRGGGGVYHVGNTKETGLTIRQAWIQYQGDGLLGVPAGIKVGRQLIKLGYGLFFDHTDLGDNAILLFIKPIKELTLAAYTIQLWERRIDRFDDSTVYGVLGAYAGKGFGLSGDITFVDHQNVLAFPPDIHLWNIGLRGNVDDIAGTGLSLKADVEFQTGEIKDITPPIKFRGWAALAGLDYKLKAIPLTLTLEYAIGSGDKPGTADKIEAFITALHRLQHYTFVYEHFTPSACPGPWVDRNTGLCNTQYIKIGGEYEITKDLKAELYGYLLRAHRAVAIGGYTPGPSKDIGEEVDARLTYKIDRGLTYFIEAGYFWPGKAYRLPAGVKPDNAWAVRHGLVLKF